MFHFEGVNALFAKLRRAVETISSLSSAEMEPGGQFRAPVPVVKLDRADSRGGKGGDKKKGDKDRDRDRDKDKRGKKKR